MARIVRGGLIQASNPVAGDAPVKKIKQAERDGELSEDERTLQLKNIQHQVDQAGQDIDNRVSHKDQELDTI